jgi:methionyl-tRNA formyltransferase
MAAEPQGRIVFMGSPEFAVPTLLALHEAPDLAVATVFTQPSRPSGRGKKLTPTAVHQRAQAAAIPVLEVSKDNYAEAVARTRAVAPDFVVVAAFGLILRRDLLGEPRHGCVNLHASLLPRHRGMSPVQAAILAGDAETGCTTMLMDEGVDTGDMLLSRSLAIAPDDTAGTLEHKLATLGAPLVVETLRGLLRGDIRPRPQDDAHATYAKRIKKEHGRIDWQKRAVDIDRCIRAMTPWPSAYTSLGDKRLIIERALPAEATAGGPPGEVVSIDPLRVATGEGCIEIVDVKVAGKKSMNAKAFCAGYRVKPGLHLGA